MKAKTFLPFAERQGLKEICTRMCRTFILFYTRGFNEHHSLTCLGRGQKGRVARSISEARTL